MQIENYSCFLPGTQSRVGTLTKGIRSDFSDVHAAGKIFDLEFFDSLNQARLDSALQN